jgi:Mlc titration factor MtfA (ptsG expression regulator)
VRLGESWARGPVILSWADSEKGALDTRDGHNVVLHEFAHQFDSFNGVVDGVPILNKGQRFAEWEKVFIDAYMRLVDKVEHGHASVINAYGATGHQEFFAVAVEVFFERPAALKHEEPEVYHQLAELFWLDPVTWN